MKKITAFASLCLAAAVLGVTLEETDTRFIVRNNSYVAKFDKQKGGRLELQISGAQCPMQVIAAGTSINLSGERESYQGTYAAADIQTPLTTQKTAAEKISASDSEIVLKFTNNLSFGTVISLVTLDDSPAIRYQMTLDNRNARLSSVWHTVSLTLSDPDGIFYPDAKRVPGMWWRNGDSVEGASWKYAWHETSKLGVGIIALPNKDLAGIEYSMQNKTEGWDSNYTAMRLVFTPLQKYGKKGSFNFQWQLIAGGTPEKAEELADSALNLKKELKFHSYEAEKLAVRPGQNNKILAQIRNRTGIDTEITAKVFAVYGLDTEAQVGEVKQMIKSGTIQKMEIPVKFPAEAKLGVALRTELYDADGTLLDKKTDFCSITDFVPRDLGFGLVNAAMCNRGAPEAWNRVFKRNYIGGYEHHCWAKSTIFGLAPEEDSWVPGTEAPYDIPLTKKFMKGLIDDAHSRGIGVYAWITGLWNHAVGLQHPEMLQYCANGQPNIYNGSFRTTNQKRRVALKANIFTVERAAAWGEEMADSIDMFGWDGCRWDFSFLPSVANDPLYMDTKVTDWYDHNGVPSSKLYPDPDTTGTECLKAWRNAVAKRHPDFIYGTNIGYSESSWRRHPKYLKEAATKGMLLFEDMLDYSRKEWATYEKWGKELAKRTDAARPYGGAPLVGAMRGLPSNSTAYHLAQYTCASAGVKWWAYAGVILHERSSERNRFFLRFAEYYFGTEFLSPEKSPVSLAEKQNVLFEPFVRQRKTANGREIVIPVVNMPENNHYICAYHDIPPVRKNMGFKIKLQPEEQAEAWLMTPQNPEKAVKLSVNDGIVRVPELVDGCMVLVRCKGGK